MCKDAAERQGAGAAAHALKAPDTTQIIRAFFRFDTELAQFMAAFAVSALIRIEPQEKNRDPIK